MAATKKTAKAKKNVADIKTPDELKAALRVSQNELLDAKRSHASRELANTERLKELRVQIARIKTSLRNLEEKA